MRGIIKSERHEECEHKNEIKIAGTSIAGLLNQHEERLDELEQVRVYSRIEALEKRLEGLEIRVNGQYEDRIGELEDRVFGSPTCSEGTNTDLESRVAVLNRL